MKKRKHEEVLIIPEKEELPTGGFGTASLVCGIVGFVIAPFMFSPLAIIFGAIGMHHKQRYSTAGFVIGIIGLVFMFFQLLYAFNTFFSAFGV
ncbi:DUF4190 domain-containing protein [Candidatus Woesearchaeota archaeon]|nr:DUF4190 domain-containing protein [Candidatus Woesearchaeota archaeon]